MTTAEADRWDADPARQCQDCRQWVESRFMAKAVTRHGDSTGTADWLDLCPDCCTQCSKCGVHYPNDEFEVVCDPCRIYDEFGNTPQYRAELARWLGQGIYVELDLEGVTLSTTDIDDQTFLETNPDQVQLPWEAFMQLQSVINSWWWHQTQQAIKQSRHTTIFRTGYTDVDGDLVYEWFGDRADAVQRQAELDEAREEIRNHPSGDLTPGVMVCTIEMFVLPADKTKLVEWLNGQRLNW